MSPEHLSQLVLVTVKPEQVTTNGTAQVDFPSGSNPTLPSRIIVLADLNANPPDGDPSPRLHQEDLVEKIPKVEAGDGKKASKSGKCRVSRGCKLEADVDGDGPDVSGPISFREEKVSSLKTGLVHVARKMPKNAHAHFILGLMYQRLGQPQKALSAYEKAEEILLKCEPEVARPDLLTTVQVHHAQCILLEHDAESSSEKELEPEELEDVISRLKDSMRSDIRQSAIWNTLGVILLKSGRVQSAIAVLSSLLTLDPNSYDCLGNLGIAYMQSGDLELSSKCFQDLILRDQNHPAAFVNYSAILLCKYGSVVAGAGANISHPSSDIQFEAANVAKQCILAALKLDPRASHVWSNLADAYNLTGDYRSSSKCLEKAARLEPSCLSSRFSVAMHRIKDAERSQDPTDQLFWAGNEMASILRDGESCPIELAVAWAGLATVHRAQHEISAAFVSEKNELAEIEERALCTLKQAAAEDPDDGTQWHQLGVHYLRAQQFNAAQKYLKLAAAHLREYCYPWSNLGISLQLSEATSEAEKVYERALTWATTKQAHAILSNLGTLYRQQRKYDKAKAMFSKALELQPGYAPAFNNLGLVFFSEGQLEQAKYCFSKALQADPLLDAAKSNMIKATSMSSSTASRLSDMKNRR